MGSSEWLGRRVVALEDVGEGTREGALSNWAAAMQDDDTQAVLREVLTPFVDRLKAEQRDLLEALFYERLTEEQVGERLGVNRSTVSRRKDTALAALVRLIALRDDGFRAYDESLHTGRRGRPVRDYDAESNAAWVVLLGLLKATR